MTIARSLFGTTPEGQKVYLYTFTDSKGQSVVMSEYACAIVSINVLDKSGKLRDVALGYDTLEEYLADTRCFGATVGRYANRIANGLFTINGVTYHLPRNNGNNTLHGGPDGFRKRLYSSEMFDDRVEFTLHSPDLDAGFPGNFTLKVTVTFEDGALRMKYDYVCDKDCPANITNHNYFNLNGHGMGSIFKHWLHINAEKYCKADEGMLALAPTVGVEGTAFDFRTSKTIASGIFSYSPELISARGGYDHCFELSGEKAAVVCGDVSGIVLEVFSDMPAVQFYTGNSIGHCRGKGGAYYNDYDGFALECQQFPNAINEPSFPDCVARAGQPVSKFIEFRFSSRS
ncbi:MAG: galactose mutarotase [Synergistaceae bacterium]|nr:galactose mutarotase [Synergistaceae bacterium]